MKLLVRSQISLLFRMVAVRVPLSLQLVFLSSGSRLHFFCIKKIEVLFSSWSQKKKIQRYEMIIDTTLSYIFLQFDITVLIVLQDGAHTLLKPPATLQRVSPFQYQRHTDSQFNQTTLVLSNAETNSDTIKYLCFSEPTFSDGNQAHPVSNLANDSDPGNPPPLTRTASRVPLNSSQADTDSAEGEVGSACIVCMERPPDAVLLECGHSGLCVGCATVLWVQARHCPLCRQSFAAVMRIVAREAGAVSAALAHRHQRRPCAPCAKNDPCNATASGEKKEEVKGKGGRAGRGREREGDWTLPPHTMGSMEWRGRRRDGKAGRGD
jgi:hypothetical protein